MMPPALRIKDLLRELRSGMTAGRVAIAPLQHDAPWPVRGLVDDLFGGLDFFASRFDAASSHLAHRVLNTTGAGHVTGVTTLDWLARRHDGDVVFAQLAYGALGAAHRRFSEVPVLVSETAAAHAFAQAAEKTVADRAHMPAAVLTNLLSGEVIRPSPFLPSAQDITTSRRLACIGFVLLFCVGQAEGGDDSEMLDLCCDAAAHIDRQVDLHHAPRETLTEVLGACARMI